MGKLIKMDLYRMTKSKGLWVCLILTFLLCFAESLLLKALPELQLLLDEKLYMESGGKYTSALLHNMIANPLPFIGAILVLIPIASFFFADSERGYIKNIAGQMPQKGYTILSKFIAVLPMNFLFLLAGVVGKLLGAAVSVRIVTDSSVWEAIGIFALKLLLLQGISCVLLLISGAFQNKALGIVLSVVLGAGVLSMIYLLIDLGLDRLFKDKSFAISEYMPSEMLQQSITAFKPLAAAIAAAVCIGLFLPLSIWIFNKRDIK